MNVEGTGFNVPTIVKNADSSLFDVAASDAVVVGGLRIDNPAAAWFAGAQIRKSANDFDHHAISLIKQACSLFNIGEDMYSPLDTRSDSVIVSDGTDTAEFNVYDTESLNEASRSLLSKRANMSYAFAHDCAQALREVAKANNYTFDADVIVPIRKLAGDYNVNFSEGRKLIEEYAQLADNLNMPEHRDLLTKIANLCTSDCSPSNAPYFIAAIDEFKRSLPLNKTATADDKLPEDVFYMTTKEFLAKRAGEVVGSVDGTEVRRSELSLNKVASISRWAADCGYSIPTVASESEVISVVNSMPKPLRDEFVLSFIGE